ncbi:MAG: HDIG domain-containing protein [Dehalococcoidia bacterium]
MNPKLDREKILDSIYINVQDGNTIKHMLATEAIMRSLARELGEDEEEWGLTGLVHDIDIELVKDDMSSHSRLGADIAEELGASETMVHAILCHNEAHDIPRETKLDRALFCADLLSEVVTDASLVRPEKLSGLTATSVMKGLRDKSFAAEVDWEQLAQCQEIGMELEEFISLGIEAMKGVASELDL